MEGQETSVRSTDRNYLQTMEIFMVYGLFSREYLTEILKKKSFLAFLLLLLALIVFLDVPQLFPPQLMKVSVLIRLSLLPEGAALLLDGSLPALVGHGPSRWL